jgi:CBS domain-containing protein
MILKNVEALLGARSFVSLSPETTVRAASRAMAQANERAALVTDDGRVAGILSERDIVHDCLGQGMDPDTTTVAAVMTADPITIDAADTVAHAIEKMLEGGFHHLPVLKAGAPIGTIYSDDIPEEYRLLLEHFRELRQP